MLSCGQVVRVYSLVWAFAGVCRAKAAAQLCTCQCWPFLIGLSAVLTCAPRASRRTSVQLRRECLHLCRSSACCYVFTVLCFRQGSCTLATWCLHDDQPASQAFVRPGWCFCTPRCISFMACLALRAQSRNDSGFSRVRLLDNTVV